MDQLGTIMGVLVTILIVFALGRQFACWYFKFTSIDNTLKEILTVLDPDKTKRKVLSSKPPKKS